MLAATPERTVSASEPADAPALVAQDNAPTAPSAAEPAHSPPPPLPPAAAAAPVPAAAAPPPLFRARTDIPAASDKPAPAIPPVIPIIRPPDDPGVDDGTEPDEFAESPAPGQSGGWRGFLSRIRG
jgi:HemY protein